MRKLLLLVALVIPTFAWAQNRQVKAALAEATVSCEGDAVPRLGPDGKIALTCLPTSTGVLSWFRTGSQIDVGASYIVKHGAPSDSASQVTYLRCYTDTGTVDLNFDARAISTPGTPGADLHDEEIVADPDAVVVTSFGGDNTNAANEIWNMSISAISGAPTELVCAMTVERL